MNPGFIKTLALSIVLTAVLIVVVNVIGDFAVRPNPGYSPNQSPMKQAEEQEPAAQKPAAMAKTDDLSSLLASIDPATAKRAFRKCKGCHASAAEARNLVGPNLWGVVGRPKASYEGYKYSSAFRGLDGDWTYEDLNTFLTDPRGFAKGTKMMFKGIKKPAGRAAVIAHLRGLSANPKPLP